MEYPVSDFHLAKTFDIIIGDHISMQVIVNTCSERVPGLLHACVCDFDGCNLSK